MIGTLYFKNQGDRQKVDALLGGLRLNPAEVALQAGERAKQAGAVDGILRDVATRGDAALVDIARRFDDPGFTADQIRVKTDEMRDAVARVPVDQLSAIRRSIAQVREYQAHVMPADPSPLKRAGVTLGMRFTPLDSAGLYFPGGKASYPSSLIMLAVPAQVAGVKRIAVVTPPSKYGRSDLILAACHELGLTDVFRAGGAAAVGALAFGTETIRAVDKIVGPGNDYVQLAKRAVSGSVGIDGYLGPSEIVTVADASANPAFIAADLIAQAEHDPGSCFLLTDSAELAGKVSQAIREQTALRDRRGAIEKALAESSAIIVTSTLDEAIDLANQFAAEHVNVQTRDDDAVVARIRHAGAIFSGPWSPVAAGDYVAGPSHCLPTNTTARFSSGISVYEFLKRSSIVRYEKEGLAADAPAIISMATAEHLDAHAASVQIRTGK